MTSLIRGAIAVTLVAALAPSLASAKPLKRHKAHVAHRTHTYAPRYGYAPEPYAGYAYAPRYGYSTGPYGPNSADPYPATEADNPYNPYAPPGAALRALARRNQNAPGVTNELAPDNIATASGGPSGGVPGFSSH